MRAGGLEVFCGVCGRNETNASFALEFRLELASVEYNKFWTLPIAFQINSGTHKRVNALGPLIQTLVAIQIYL